MEQSVIQFVERRKWPRFGVVVPVAVGNGRGRTRNLCMGGAYLEVERSPGNFASIFFTLDFGGDNAAEPTRYHCAGTVVRVHPRADSAEQWWGVAVRIELVAGEDEEDGWFSGPVCSSRRALTRNTQ
jgi:hypothetical protein